MQQGLGITLVQMDTIWHDPAANRAQIETLLQQFPQTHTCDLIALPEMFTTGFTMEAAAQAETMGGDSVAWMRDIAQQYQAIVTGTLIIREQDRIFNRLIWMPPDGDCQWYDKKHLFRMADEHSAYSAGSARPIFSVGEWRVRPIVCYDLRFPVWCRTRHNDYDLLVCLANWPSPRHHAWVNLNQARAIENMACVAAVNRVGKDALGKQYLGGSMIINAKGEIIQDAQDKAGVVQAYLKREELQDLRDKFPVHKDADDFTLID